MSDIDNEIRHRSHLQIIDKDSLSEAQKIKIQYFERMYSCFCNENFKNEIHRFILELAVDGAKICEIHRALQANGINRHRKTVRHIIRKFEHKWGIREWSRKEMDLKPLKPHIK